MGKDPPFPSAASAADPGDARQLSGKGAPEPLNQWRRVVLIEQAASTQPFRDPAPGHPDGQRIRDDRPRQPGAGPDLKDRVLDQGRVRFVGAGVTAQRVRGQFVESGRACPFLGVRASGLGPVRVARSAGSAGRGRWSSRVHLAGPSAVRARRNAIEDARLVQRDCQLVCGLPGHGGPRPFRAGGPFDPDEEPREATLSQSVRLDSSGDGVRCGAGKATADCVDHLGPGPGSRHRNSPARTTFALRIRSRAARSG
jgi:hypothetical protein